MLFSFDTAWQKSGGASAPPAPRPPGPPVLTPLSLGKTNDLHSPDGSTCPMNFPCGRSGSRKDHEKVMSLVAMKEHVTFSVAWHESKQKL